MKLTVAAYRHNEYVPGRGRTPVKLGEVTREIPDSLPYYVIGEQVALALDNIKRKGYSIQDLEFHLRFEP